ncbi:DUF3348 domain-containing protein [Paraburkholderia sp. G-4-1-8]|uniref:DUF3348 domain-containing protein n=1 Tax=Paraburkholderia antibiotica TaxID=2728839 RepID=A0A7Y0A0Z3_9BURK|nr:DUF3348 domain-containing protein [Paraburkholderia antibiotica]NML34454.1 DUF3348 domain-containing protein [Paraburkholderia antibiotica]
MSQAPQRSALSGPALVRLLARLAEVDVAESRQSLADRLSQWLGWTDAIALSSALNGAPPAVAGGARAFGRAEEDECTRVRRSLVSAIAGDSVFAGARRRGSPSFSAPGAPMAASRVAVDTPADYAVFRQRYLALQQSMETAIGTLRGRLRALLATQAPALARLAVVDAVMERALGERERTLLGAVPGLLGGHFERLREAEKRRVAAIEAQAEAAAQADADAVTQGDADTAAQTGASADAADAGMAPGPQPVADVEAGAQQAAQLQPQSAPAAVGTSAMQRQSAAAEAQTVATTAVAAAAAQPRPAPAHTEAPAHARVAAVPPPTATTATQHTAPVAPDAWLDVFRKDMQSVLLAELDVRFQPVEGLLAALRAC